MRASCIATFPGGSTDPEIIAANVSRMWCLVASIASAGTARDAASAIYALSASMTGAVASGVAATERPGMAAAASNPPAPRNNARRVNAEVVSVVRVFMVMSGEPCHFFVGRTL